MSNQHLNGEKLMKEIDEADMYVYKSLIKYVVSNIFVNLPSKFNTYFTYEVNPTKKTSLILTWWYWGKDNGIHWVELSINDTYNPKEVHVTIRNDKNYEFSDSFETITYCVTNKRDESDENSLKLIADTIKTIVSFNKLVTITNDAPIMNIVGAPVEPEHQEPEKDNKKSIENITNPKPISIPKRQLKTIDDRISWDQYFMEMCDLVAKRSTCLRRQIGAVIVKDNRVLATGYNGAPKGITHCKDRGGCIREELNVKSGTHQELDYAVHAEMNAIAQAAKYGIAIDGSVLYCNTRPCSICTRLIINSGITKVYYRDFYPDELSDELLKEAGIPLIKVG